MQSFLSSPVRVAFCCGVRAISEPLSCPKRGEVFHWTGDNRERVVFRAPVLKLAQWAGVPPLTINVLNAGGEVA